MNRQFLFSKRAAQMRRSSVRELLKVIGRPEMISFAGGIPAPELFPVEEIAQAAAAALKHSPRQALQYGETEGVAELRDWIAARYSQPHCPVRRENVMIVTGSQQALDLIGRVFIDSGDRVLVENPTYLAALSAWRPFYPTFIAVPSDSKGARLDSLPELLQPAAKLIYLVPNFQNPQGTTLCLERRQQLIAQVKNTKTLVVEDNPYGDLRYDGEALPHLLHLDGIQCPGVESERSVIHLGSFSKVLAPGFRVGWVIAPLEIIDKLVEAKQAADLHTSTFCQHVILHLVRAGVLDRQIPKLCGAYRIRRDTMLGAIENYLPPEISWTRPDGGMFLMANLPKDIDAAELLQFALKRNVAFVPGDDFYIDHQGRNTMRLNFSNASPEKIENGVKRLAAAWSDLAATSGAVYG